MVSTQDSPASFTLPRSGLILFAVAACVVPLGYSLYTGQVWEDALITLRHGENLLHGDGLTYNPGERVHGFTSPVNVLLLTLCHLLTGQSSYVATCWLYRLFTIAAYAGAGVLLLEAFNRMLPRWTPATWFLAVMYLFDHKSVAFSTNGMETGFVLLLLAWAIYLLLVSTPERWIARGLCWGAMMWTRPDGCVYIVALSLAELIFLRSGVRRATLVALAKSAVLAAVLYSPWLVWAWSYYGSPVPHTVIAKADVENGAVSHFLTTMDNLSTQMFMNAALVFRPIYDRDTSPWVSAPSWVRVINGITKCLGIFCLVYWTFPISDRFGRACSFCFAVLCFYFSYMIYTYPWYYPPAALLALLILARGATMLVDRASNPRAAPSTFWSYKTLALAGMGFLVVGQITLFLLTAWEERIQQFEIEDNQRAVIGTWLKEHGQPTENVYLEPLGYIGYFSGMRMIDFPGLVSPETVRVRREKGLDRVTAIGELKPDWVVLRFWEYELLSKSAYAANFVRDYTLMRVFNVNEKLNQYAFLPGQFIIRYDAAFAVFRRNATPASPALPPED